MKLNIGIVILEVVEKSNQKEPCRELMDELIEIFSIIGSSVLTLKGKK